MFIANKYITKMIEFRIHTSKKLWCVFIDVGRWKEGGGRASCSSHMELWPRGDTGQPMGHMPGPSPYNMPPVKRGMLPPYVSYF